jgi:hypothetical protein
METNGEAEAPSLFAVTPGPAGLGAIGCLSSPGTVNLSSARAAFTHKNWLFARQSVLTRGAHERECCDRAKRWGEGPEKGAAFAPGHPSGREGMA